MPKYYGTWFTRNEPHLGYRVIPKCGCSSIGQLLHYLDQGTFFAGSVHDEHAPILKWKHLAISPELQEIATRKRVFCFTLGRNPYRRLLSTFSDKVMSKQRQGKLYRAGAILRALRAYGVTPQNRDDLPRTFKRFVRFVADTIELAEPMKSDIHWRSCTEHLLFTLNVAPEWKLDFVGHIEHIERDLVTVLSLSGVDAARLPKNLPRENATSLPPIPITDFYGPAEIEAMKRIYADDFRLFNYETDPLETKPRAAVDVNDFNHALREIAATSEPLIAETDA